MDLSYFDKLIKAADEFMYNLTDDNDRGIIHNLIVNYEGFKKRINLKKRSFSDYDTSLKYFDTLGKKSKDELKATFNPIVNRAKNQLDNIKTNYWHISARESGEELRKLGHDKQVLRVLDFLENFYEQFSEGLKSFKGQLYENKNKIQKIIKEYGIHPMFKEFCNNVAILLNKNFDGVVLNIDGLKAAIKIPNQSETGLYHARNFGVDSYDLVVSLEDVNNNFVKITIGGGYTHKSEDPQDAADYITLIAKTYERNSNDFRFNKKLNLPLQEMKTVKHTTVGNLKRKINESRERTALGMGFGSKPAYESNVDQMMSSYQRKIGNKGTTGLGQGFKQMDETQMVEFISNMVESLKGKTEYHNLKFVDRLGSEYFLNERQVRTIKSIIKEGSKRAPKKLKRYINENLAIEAQDMYEGYYGLTNEAESMIPEIKKMFNENKRACGSSEEAAQMTAEALDIPQEMVQEMYEKMKESYEMKMEGGHMDVEGALHEIYGKYQNMSEGNMEPMYQEISELMMYEEDMPLDEVMSFSDEEMNLFTKGSRYRKERDGEEEEEEEEYNPFEERDADNPEYGIDEEYLYEDDEMCEQCGKSEMYESIKRKINSFKKSKNNKYKF